MENRLRMVAACFLVKSLMIDWREYFHIPASSVQASLML